MSDFYNFDLVFLSIFAPNHLNAEIVGGFAISLDGFFEGPNGESDWMTMEGLDFTEHMKRFDTFLMGRKSYEQLIKMGNANSFSKIKTYVFSTTLRKINPPHILVTEGIKETITELKIQPGKDIAVYGGADLLTSLLNLNLVDEIILSVMPVILGNGKRFIGQINNRMTLTHTGTKKFSSGVVMLSYNIKHN